jgi:hypothetical protein
MIWKLVFNVTNLPLYKNRLFLSVNLNPFFCYVYYYKALKVLAF